MDGLHHSGGVTAQGNLQVERPGCGYFMNSER